MRLTPREKDKLLIAMAANVARRRLERGVKLNHPEAIALISDFIVEGARDGRKVAELMRDGASALLVHAGPGAATHLPLVRDLLATSNAPVRCAATCVNGILLVRWLAVESIDIRPSFARVWTALRAAARKLSPTLPTFWHH